MCIELRILQQTRATDTDVTRTERQAAEILELRSQLATFTTTMNLQTRHHDDVYLKLLAEKDALAEEITRLRSCVDGRQCQPRGFAWIRDRRYTDGTIPTAPGWLNLVHDRRLLDLQRQTDPTKEGAYVYATKTQHRAVDFVDYVMTQMAGGEPHLNQFVRDYVFKTSRLAGAFSDIRASTPNTRLFHEAKQVLN